MYIHFGISVKKSVIDFMDIHDLLLITFVMVNYNLQKITTSNENSNWMMILNGGKININFITGTSTHTLLQKSKGYSITPHEGGIKIKK